MITIEQLIQAFQLAPHAEGGYYRETYRSKESIGQSALPSRFTAARNFATAIYFLVEQGNFSAFHRIRSDECWHFYAGQSLYVHVLHPTGEYELIRLGPDIDESEVFQAVVPAGAWFASETAPGGNFSFVGCTVAPGFDFADFELATAGSLAAQFPGQAALIRRLTRS
jgi:predicted cupin superfamily sugar epimerase